MRMTAVVVLSFSLLACGAATQAPVRPGIEVLLADSLHLVRGHRVALLTNHTGVDRAGRRDADLLLAAGIELRALFSPEHGFQGAEDREGLPDAQDSATGLPIYSLYSGRRPNFGALDSVQVLLVDLQDIGGRTYTYVASAAEMLRPAAARGVRVVVLDRPNPIGGALVQGNVPDSVGDPVRERVGFLPIAMRHGLTIGEMLRWANDALAAGAEVRVVPAAGWRRDAYYDALGLPWVPPSPNMPDLESASHYPGLVLFEYTNLSVGRGTPRAFQWIGAPWLDPAAVVAWLREAVPEALAGVNVEETAFTPVSPTDGKYDGVALRGLRFRVTDRARYDPPRLAVALLAALQRIHAATFRFNERPFDRLAMGTTLRRQVLSGLTPQQIWTDWAAPLAHYRERRGKYLLY
jgi:uncharacterized protein YbbC (DUF1343 family)